MNTVPVGTFTEISEAENVSSSDVLLERVDRLMRCIEDLSQRLPMQETDHEIAAFGVMTDEADEPLPPTRIDPSKVGDALGVAKTMLARYRTRDKRFGDGLFSDPAWEVLLELYVARVRGENMSIGSACIAAAVPLTSALRWCQQLQRRNIVRRERDPKDGRRIFLRLTDDSFNHLTDVLLVKV